jgi:uncharacterized membrane protein
MQEKYSFLPFAAKVLRVVGWVILVLGVISSIVYGILTGGITGVLMAIMGIIFSFLAWVFLLASKELLYLFMDVEENTRNTAERIAKKSD